METNTKVRLSIGGAALLLCSIVGVFYNSVEVEYLDTPHDGDWYTGISGYIDMYPMIECRQDILNYFNTYTDHRFNLTQDKLDEWALFGLEKLDEKYGLPHKSSFNGTELTAVCTELEYQAVGKYINAFSNLNRNIIIEDYTFQNLYNPLLTSHQIQIDLKSLAQAISSDHNESDLKYAMLELYNHEILHSLTDLVVLDSSFTNSDQLHISMGTRIVNTEEGTAILSTLDESIVEALGQYSIGFGHNFFNAYRLSEEVHDILVAKTQEDSDPTKDLDYYYKELFRLHRASNPVDTVAFLFDIPKEEIDFEKLKLIAFNINKFNTLSSIVLHYNGEYSH